MAADRWFALFDSFSKTRDLAGVRAQVSPALIDRQDEWGMTATMCSVMMKWPEALTVLLANKPDLSLHYFRTGEAALQLAVGEGRRDMVAALLEAGANPDLANHHGYTPRAAAEHRGLADLFAPYPPAATVQPAPRIQNAEHLEDHYHPRFKIPKRDEREHLEPGQAVTLYVYGPIKENEKVQVRIFARTGEAGDTRYDARIDPANQPHNLTPGTETVTFGPEHVATVFLKRPR